jgi:hypothetical protein
MQLDQLAKKIGISLKRRFLPLEGNPLFHSELAAGARQKKSGCGLISSRRNRDFPQKALFAFRG